MRKRFAATMLVCLCVIDCLAQLRTTTHEEAGNYSIVYETKYLGRIGQVRHIKSIGEYVLFGQSTNLREETMHSIFLGKDKESAIKTLSDLKALKSTIGDKTLLVDGFLGKTTKIWKEFGCLGFKTEGVVGYTAILCSFKYDKAIKALNAYQE